MDSLHQKISSIALSKVGIELGSAEKLLSETLKIDLDSTQKPTPEEYQKVAKFLESLGKTKQEGEKIENSETMVDHSLAGTTGILRMQIAQSADPGIIATKIKALTDKIDKAIDDWNSSHEDKITKETLPLEQVQNLLGKGELKEDQTLQKIHTMLLKKAAQERIHAQLTGIAKELPELDNTEAMTHAPAKIEHNRNPDSCYAAALLNIVSGIPQLEALFNIAKNGARLFDEETNKQLGSLLRALENRRPEIPLFSLTTTILTTLETKMGSEAQTLKEILTNFYKNALENLPKGLELIQKFIGHDKLTARQNILLGDILNELSDLLFKKPTESKSTESQESTAPSLEKKWDTLNALINQFLKSTENNYEIKELKDFFYIFERAKHGVATAIREVIKGQICNDIRTAVFSLLEKMTNQQTVTAKEINDFQNVLRRYNFIELDLNTNEDPKGILQTLLQYLDDGTIRMSEGTQTTYSLKEAKVTKTGLPEEGDIILESTGKKDEYMSKTPSLSMSPFIILTPTQSKAKWEDFASSGKTSINLMESITEHFIRKEGGSEGVTAWIKTKTEEPVEYTLYEKVAKTETRRTIDGPMPETLLLQVSGNPSVTFSDRIEVNGEYYLLKKVECHQDYPSRHEYTYLEKDGYWFLSDDMRPITPVQLIRKSEAVQDMCAKGRLFVYVKTTEEPFKKTLPMTFSPVKTGTPSPFGNLGGLGGIGGSSGGRSQLSGILAKGAPGKIGHNPAPNSCYAAALLNMILDDQIAETLFSTDKKSSQLGEKKEALLPLIGQVLRNLQNVDNPQDIYNMYERIGELQLLLGTAGSSDTLGNITKILENVVTMSEAFHKHTLEGIVNLIVLESSSSLPPQILEDVKQLSLAFKVGATINDFENLICRIEQQCRSQNIKHPLHDALKDYRALKVQLGAELMKCLKEEISMDLKQAITSRLEIIRAGKALSVKNIAEFQQLLRHYNFIEHDTLTDEDPKGLLQTLLNYVDNPEFHITEKTTTTYSLDESIKTETLVPEPPKHSIVLEGTEELHSNATPVSMLPYIQLTPVFAKAKTESTLTEMQTSGATKIDIQKAITEHFKQDDKGSHTVNAYVKENEGYRLYENVKKIETARQWDKLPSSLHLQISGNSKVTFPLKFSLKEPGPEKFYVLKKVLCHTDQPPHEYVYIKRGNNWFLSDDIKSSVQNAYVNPDSDDVHKMCAYGREFVYEEVKEEAFKAIQEEVFSTDAPEFNIYDFLSAQDPDLLLLKKPAVIEEIVVSSQPGNVLSMLSKEEREIAIRILARVYLLTMKDESIDQRVKKTLKTIVDQAVFELIENQLPLNLIPAFKMHPNVLTSIRNKENFITVQILHNLSGKESEDIIAIGKSLHQPFQKMNQEDPIVRIFQGRYVHFINACTELKSGKLDLRDFTVFCYASIANNKEIYVGEMDHKQLYTLLNQFLSGDNNPPENTMPQMANLAAYLFTKIDHRLIDEFEYTKTTTAPKQRKVTRQKSTQTQIQKTTAKGSPEDLKKALSRIIDIGFINFLDTHCSQELKQLKIDSWTAILLLRGDALDSKYYSNEQERKALMRLIATMDNALEEDTTFGAELKFLFRQEFGQKIALISEFEVIDFLKDTKLLEKQKNKSWMETVKTFRNKLKNPSQWETDKELINNVIVIFERLSKQEPRSKIMETLHNELGTFIDTIVNNQLKTIVNTELLDGIGVLGALHIIARFCANADKEDVLLPHLVLRRVKLFQVSLEELETIAEQLNTFLTGNMEIPEQLLKLLMDKFGRFIDTFKAKDTKEEILDVTDIIESDELETVSISPIPKTEKEKTELKKDLLKMVEDFPEIMLECITKTGTSVGFFKNFVNLLKELLSARDLVKLMTEENWDAIVEKSLADVITPRPDRLQSLYLKLKDMPEPQEGDKEILKLLKQYATLNNLIIGLRVLAGKELPTDYKKEMNKEIALKKNIQTLIENLKTKLKELETNVDRHINNELDGCFGQLIKNDFSFTETMSPMLKDLFIRELKQRIIKGNWGSISGTEDHPFENIMARIQNTPAFLELLGLNPVNPVQDAYSKTPAAFTHALQMYCEQYDPHSLDFPSEPYMECQIKTKPLYKYKIYEYKDNSRHYSHDRLFIGHCKGQPPILVFYTEGSHLKQLNGNWTNRYASELERVLKYDHHLEKK